MPPARRPDPRLRGAAYDIATESVPASSGPDAGREPAVRAPAARDAQNDDPDAGHLEDSKHRGLIVACGTGGTVKADGWRKILDDITSEYAGQTTVFLLDPGATEMVNARVSLKRALPPDPLLRRLDTISDAEFDRATLSNSGRPRI